MCHANPCNPSRMRFTKLFMVISVISIFQMYFRIWDADKTTSLWAMPLAVFRWLSPCLVTSSNSGRVHGAKSDKPHLISSVHVFTKKKSQAAHPETTQRHKKTHLESSSCAWKVSYKASKITPKHDFHVWFTICFLIYSFDVSTWVRPAFWISDLSSSQSKHSKCPPMSCAMYQTLSHTEHIRKLAKWCTKNE